MPPVDSRIFFRYPTPIKSSLIQTYLFFGGRCDEALEFYRQAVGAKIEMLMRYSESPQPMPAGSIPAGFEKKVMHATFRIGTSQLMASDGTSQQSNFSGFALSLATGSEEEAQRAFAALSEGGQVSMPIGKTFWSPCFGMVKDRFGVSWMVTIAS